MSLRCVRNSQLMQPGKLRNFGTAFYPLADSVCLDIITTSVQDRTILCSPIHTLSVEPLQLPWPLNLASSPILYDLYSQPHQR